MQFGPLENHAQRSKGKHCCQTAAKICFYLHMHRKVERYGKSEFALATQCRYLTPKLSVLHRRARLLRKEGRTDETDMIVVDQSTEALRVSA